MRDRFGGVLGANLSPTVSSASGVWTLREAERLRRAGSWPSPTDLTAIAGNGQVTLSWADAGQSWSINYSTHSINGEPVWDYYAEATSPATVTGLSNGTAYIFAVLTITGEGDFVQFESRTVTPSA